MATTETRKMVLAAAAVCDDKKAENTRVLELDPADSAFTDFFLITSGANTRQTVAIADDIELKMKREFSTYPNSVEGRRAGEWILMDYVDFVVHIFLEEKRAFYDIERLRKSARSIDLTQLKAALAEKTAAVRRIRQRPSEPAAQLNPTPGGPMDPIETSQLAEPAAAADQLKTPRRRSPGIKQTAPAKKSAKRAAAGSAVKKSAAKKVSAKKSAAKKSTAKKSATRIAAAAEATGKRSAKSATQSTARKAANKTLAKRTPSSSSE